MAMPLTIDRAKAIDGWMSEQELWWIAGQARMSRRVLEVGSYKGRSARAWMDNLPPDGVLYVVDPWAGDYRRDDGSVDPITKDLPGAFTAFRETMQDVWDTGRLVVIREPWRQVRLENVKFDTIFLDGDHRYETVFHDMHKALNSLEVPDGMLCGHDFGVDWWPGVEGAVREMFGAEFGIHDTIWFTKPWQLEVMRQWHTRIARHQEGCQWSS